RARARRRRASPSLARRRGARTGGPAAARRARAAWVQRASERDAGARRARGGDLSSNAVARAVAVVRLGRPVFLLGGFALYGLGALAAVRRGYRFDGVTFALGQLAVSSIQLMTHYCNDYYDYEADTANQTPTRWSG